MRKNLLALMIAVLAIALFSSITGYAACKAGDKAEVLWKGTWYPAMVLKAKSDQCYIHYDGYGSNWDEWVGPDRIKGAKTQAAGTKKFSEGDPVQVKWKGTWYAAHVIAVGKNQWKIHYDGYDSSWDEWVGAARIK
jgi:hypothetical protein